MKRQDVNGSTFFTSTALLLLFLYCKVFIQIKCSHVAASEKIMLVNVLNVLLWVTVKNIQEASERPMLLPSTLRGLL